MSQIKLSAVSNRTHLYRNMAPKLYQDNIRPLQIAAGVTKVFNISSANCIQKAQSAPMKLPFKFGILLLAMSAMIRAAPTAYRTVYFWRIDPVGSTAQLATLFCQRCQGASSACGNVPLVAVLRDTLGDDDPENDRLTSVWLLTYSRPNIGQRLLSAVPFFYWRVGNGSEKSAAKGTAPLLDLTSLQHPMINTVERDVLQWAMLDPSTTPIRATSRAYRTNETDHERLHLEEVISYLRQSPSGNGPATLTSRQINTLIARLELRKTLLGGFVSQRAAARIGEEASTRYERIRSRNWELLREYADKTGLYFEPLNVAASSGEYAILWFPLDESAQPEGTRLGPIWKLLNIKNPWNDVRLKSASAVGYPRDLDADGNLLPMGKSGVRQVKLFPLSVYSLNYPKMPLLLVDFRSNLHVKWHEMTQRSINEITAGVIGMSHLTNWYYYVAADVYDFIESRHGAATDLSARLDCYSQFRVQLQLDNQLDSRLRREMQQRVDALAVNPLESAPQSETAAASTRYGILQQEAATGRLLKSVEKNRRAELALDTETKKEVLWNYALHIGSFGIYTRRVKPNVQNLARVDTYRRAQYELALLDQISDAGTQPEVAYDPAKIQHAIAELKQVMPEVASRDLRAHAAATLERMRSLSQDDALQSDCSTAIASLSIDRLPHGDRVALKPSVLRSSSLKRDHVAIGGDGLE